MLYGYGCNMDTKASFCIPINTDKPQILYNMAYETCTFIKCFEPKKKIEIPISTLEENAFKIYANQDKSAGAAGESCS